MLDLELRKIAGGQGFFISVKYLADQMEGGLEIGKAYNLEITPSEGQKTEMNDHE